MRQKKMTRNSTDNNRRNPQNRAPGATGPRIDHPKDLKEDDIVIAVMGPTGAGKSTFIRTLTSNYGGGYDNEEVSDSLRTATSIVSGVRIRPGNLNIVLVDTPGFDDTTRTDLDILRTIASWLGNIPGDDKKIAGIIYLHRITDIRISRTVVKNFGMFQKICGEDFFNRVVLATTMWPTSENPSCREDEEECEHRESELKEKYWKTMIDLGSTAHRFKPTNLDSALEILSHITQRRLQDQVWVQIHKEINGGHAIPKTEAGKRLHEIMEDLVIRQSDVLKSLKQELAKSSGQDPNVIATLLDELRQLRIEKEKYSKDIQALDPPARKIFSFLRKGN